MELVSVVSISLTMAARDMNYLVPNQLSKLNAKQLFINVSTESISRISKSKWKIDNIETHSIYSIGSEKRRKIIRRTSYT